MIVEYALHGNLRDFLRERRPGSSTYAFASPTPGLLPLLASATADRNEGLLLGVLAASLTTPTEDKNPIKPLTFTNLVSFAYQIARGMEYLSSKMVKYDLFYNGNHDKCH